MEKSSGFNGWEDHGWKISNHEGDHMRSLEFDFVDVIIKKDFTENQRENNCHYKKMALRREQEHEG